MNEPATSPHDPVNEPEPSALRIEKLVYGGDGLARQNGQVVLLPFVLPGELVRAETRPAKGATLRGEVAALIESSTERVQPVCRYFADCGGCATISTPTSCPIGSNSKQPFSGKPCVASAA